MSNGFFHPDVGYWETTSQPTQEHLDGYPEGFIEVSLRPDDGHEYEVIDGVWVQGALIVAPKKREGSFRDFMKMFTPDEQMKIVGATLVDPMIKFWYDTAMGGPDFSLDHPDTLLGLNTLVSAELLTQERADEILEGDFNNLPTDFDA